MNWFHKIVNCPLMTASPYRVEKYFKFGGTYIVLRRVFFQNKSKTTSEEVYKININTRLPNAYISASYLMRSTIRIKIDVSQSIWKRNCTLPQFSRISMNNINEDGIRWLNSFIHWNYIKIRFCWVQSYGFFKNLICAFLQLFSEY